MEQDQQTVRKMIEDVRIGMLTTVAADGRLLSRPMATQEVDDNGDVLFITQRHNDLVKAIEARPNVNIAYADKGTWVSLTGHAQLVDDDAKLRELWSRMTDMWTEGGPDDPDNVLLKVSSETAEYWGGTEDGAGGRTSQLIQMVKGAVTGQQPDTHHDTVDMR